MSCILDSSAIFRSMKDRATDAVAGSYTLELAGYELRNIVWKQHTLFKTIDKEESLRLIRVIADILNTLEVLHAEGVEDRILELAVEHSVTFYDASYLFHARERGLPLVTEDTELIGKARKMEIKASPSKRPRDSLPRSDKGQLCMCQSYLKEEGKTISHDH